MKIKRIDARLITTLIAFVLCLVGFAALATKGLADGNKAKIGEKEYATLADAVVEAEAGQTIEIIAGGTYTVPNIPKNITVKGTVEDVVFNCVGSGSIASVPNGATFENVSMNFGNENYHGFQHAGTINMKACTLTGKFFSYGDMNFTNCTFNAPNGDYSMWLYGMDVNFKNCTFNGNGKFFNVYNEGNGEYTITVDSCTANNTGDANKAVFNSKETCGNTILNNRVVLKGANTYTGNAPAVGGIVLNSFVQVDDRATTKDGENGVKVTIEAGATLNGEALPAGEIYNTNPKVAKIGDTAYEKFSDAIDAAENGDTIVLLTDCNVVSTYRKKYGNEGYSEGAGNNRLIMDGNGKNFTLDLGGHTLTGRINLYHVDLTVKNGDLRSSSQALNVYGTESIEYKEKSYTHLTVEKDVTISSDGYGVAVFGGDPNNTYSPIGFGETVDLSCRINAPTAVGTTGNLGMDTYEANLGKRSDLEAIIKENGAISKIMAEFGPVIDIHKDAKFTSTDVTVYLPGVVRTNVYGGTLTGHDVFSIKGGILNVSDGEFIANGPKIDPVTAVNSCEEPSGAAISVSSTYQANYPISVNIIGGKFESQHNAALLITHSFNDQTAVPYIQGIKVNVSGGLFKGDGEAVFVDAKQEADKKYLESGFITGGYYTSDVKAYVVDGYHCIATPDSDPNQKEYPYMIGTAHVKPIEEKKKTEIKEQAQSDAGKKAGHELSEPEKVKVAEKVNSVIDQIQNNNAVAQVDTKANDAVIKNTNTILKNHKADLGSATDLINTDTTIAIELKQVEVTKVIGQQITEATQVTVGKAVYNVEPVATVTTEERDNAGNVIKTETKEITLTNADLNGKPITVRLAVPETAAKQAKVTHQSTGYPDEIFFAVVQGTAPNQFIDIEMTHFSDVIVETLDELNSDTVAVIDRGGALLEFNSLADAVAGVKDGETIQLLKDIPEGTITVSRAVSFKINANGHTNKATIAADEGYTLSKDDDTYTIAKKDDSGKQSDNANTGIIKSNSTTPIVMGLIALAVVGSAILLIRRKKERE